MLLTGDWLGSAEEICMQCGGHCRVDAHPPVSRSCSGRPAPAVVSEDLFGEAGYKRLKVPEDGACILSKNGKCALYTIKPETCRAGPFTFDSKGHIIEIYLKYSRTCPLVTLLKETYQEYQIQYDLAEKSITRHVRNLTQDEIDPACRIDEPEPEKVSKIPRRSPEIS